MKKLAMCVTCGSEVKPKTRVPGSFIMEVLLWILLIVPGFIYSFWRLTNIEKVCSVCGANTLVPLDSPVARHLRTSLNGTVSPTTEASPTHTLPPPAPTRLPPLR